ncbi:hypothetical protein GCM10011519_32640 [Marmoricola endophyticus]|uniref:Nucleotidyltransferase n=1 Tax=Marmoricola endophyticus TaxID=2040280 RepID=A0A917F6P9_9ACTN|nr:nucleotidyltransferase [Marmoricola endophyticus]GGF56178.1 hypothetical protein GCM10011519_32640 [Marmoricola endophyticus]
MAVQHIETSSPFGSAPTIEEVLEHVRRHIQVSDDELAEARRRRDLITAALTGEFPGSRTYVNGSVAHGDALDPLTDIDLGVVVAEAKDTHGPGKKGCADLQERAAGAIRAALEDEFPDLRIEWKKRHRSILVRFSKAVAAGQADFTADVIVAIEHPTGVGLFIPNHATWSRSHPEQHTKMVRAANKKTSYTYARTVRLLKHWNRKNQKPLCSWNIKALALGCLTKPMPLATAMLIWFDYAIAELDKGLTEDPAGVAEKPIGLNDNRTAVVDRLRRARARLARAVELEKGGYPVQAHEEMAKFFRDDDILPGPDPYEVTAETAHKFETDRRKSINILPGPAAAAGAAGVATAASTAAAATPVVGHRPEQRTPSTRSWGTR